MASPATTGTAPASASARDGDALRASDWLVLGAALVLFATIVWQVRSFVTDDAYISLRYARNLAEGHGLVWNPGGPRVEGFSNPLLVLLEAVAFRLFGGGGAVLARAIGLGSGVLLVLAVWWLARVVVGRSAANVAALLVAAMPALALWSVGGLETLPVVLIVTTAALLLARTDGGNPALVATLLVALPWLRPEGLALAGVLVLASEVPALLRADRRSEALRRLLWLAGLPLAAQAALQVLRWAWFGHLLPNPVIFKAGTEQFGLVTAKFLYENVLILPFAALGFLLLPGRARLLAAVPALYGVASLTFRDSVNFLSRLVLPALPPLIVLAAVGVIVATARLRGRGPTVLAAAATAGIAAGTLLVMPPTVADAARFAAAYQCRDESRREAGAWIDSNAAPDATIAVGDAGLVPYAARRTTIDLFGLNEPYLQATGPLAARDRADAALDAAPDYILLASRRSDAFDHHYGVDRRISADERFEPYVLRFVADSGPGCEYHLRIYGR